MSDVHGNLTALEAVLDDIDAGLGSFDVIELLDGDQLRDASGDDPMVRAVVLAGRITGKALAGYGAYVWQGIHRGGLSISGIGSPVGAAQIFESIRAEDPDLQYASLPRGWLKHVQPSLVERNGDWDWFWTDKPPGLRPNSDRASWLGPTDEDDVHALLEDAMPEAAAWPGGDRVRRWAGIRDHDNRLVACTADTARSPLIGHLSSVATATDQRRKGYGAALIAWVTRQYLEEGAAMVTLGMYADNVAGRRLYDRLGFTCRHEFTSASVIS